MTPWSAFFLGVNVGMLLMWAYLAWSGLLRNREEYERWMKK